MTLKILVLVKTFNPYTETFIYNDVMAMNATHQVQVVAMERVNESIRPFDHFTLIPDYTPHFVLQKYRGLKRRLNLGLDYRFPPIQHALDNILKAFQPDIIHCHFGHLALYFLDNMRVTCPIFLNFHGNDATRKIHTSVSYRKRIKALLQDQQIYPLGTSTSLFEFMESYGINSPRSQVIYSGVDPAFFKKENSIVNKTKTLLQVGGFRSKKGHQYTLRAFHLLLQKYPDLKLIFVGSGGLEPEIKALAAALNISPNVTFKGWCTQKETKELLEQADVFIHPSITTHDYDMESTTVAIMEAMAMELPIFSTLHSGIPELVEHGVNGLLAPERDIDTYVKYMERLLDWGPQPQNRQKIIDQFSHQAHIDQLIAAYKKAINAK